MTISKFQGKTKEEAIKNARDEFGENAVIMNVKEVKPKGLFAIFKASTYEVTAAKEEREEFVNPVNALKTPEKLHESISLAADEKIQIPKYERVEREENATPSFNVQQLLQKEIRQAKSELGIGEKSSGKREQNQIQSEEKLEQRLDQISNSLTRNEEKSAPEGKGGLGSDELNFVKILYTTLIKNEVNEKYVNQILDEIERFLRPGNSLDTILSNVYQKLILRFGQPHELTTGNKKPKLVCFFGPTGVGKTTTIAKIASKCKVEQGKKIAFITADTYRIAATEQLRVYANILDAPMSIVYSPEEMNGAIQGYLDYDLIFSDTAGFSHKNESQCQDMKKLLDVIEPQYDREVYLVLSATTKYQDLIEISDIYKEISTYKLIFTKLDETTTYGNLLNIKLHSGAELSYVTNGQNVPEDIELFDTQKIVKQLLGGK